LEGVSDITRELVEAQQAVEDAQEAEKTAKKAHEAAVIAHQHARSARDATAEKACSSLLDTAAEVRAGRLWTNLVDKAAGYLQIGTLQSDEEGPSYTSDEAEEDESDSEDSAASEAGKEDMSEEVQALRMPDQLPVLEELFAGQVGYRIAGCKRSSDEDESAEKRQCTACEYL
jgi:hypothetical protein